MRKLLLTGCYASGIFALYDIDGERLKQSQTILEAMSCSMPIISTDVGGIPEVVRFGQDGVKTDGTEESIKVALSDVIKQYDNYSMSAWERSNQYDYRIVNEVVLRKLNVQLGWF